METNDTIIELIAEMNGKIGELCGDIKAVMARLEKGDEKIADHEKRIHDLESSKPNRTDLISTIVSAGVKWGPWIVGALILVIMKLTGTQAPAIPQ